MAGLKSERILPFTDAVVAIAMTLLILPLVELASRTQGLHRAGDVGPVLAESIGPFVGLVVSFFVIARLWWAHHQVLAGIEEWTVGLVVLDVLWLFTVVLLPFPTALSTSFEPSWALALVYVGEMTLSSAMLTLIARTMARRRPRDFGAVAGYYGNLVTTSAFAVALVLCMLFPVLWYGPLLLLALTGFIDKAVQGRLAQRIPEPAE